MQSVFLVGFLRTIQLAYINNYTEGFCIFWSARRRLRRSGACVAMTDFDAMSSLSLANRGLRRMEVCIHFSLVISADAFYIGEWWDFVDCDRATSISASLTALPNTSCFYSWRLNHGWIQIHSVVKWNQLFYRHRMICRKKTHKAKMLRLFCDRQNHKKRRFRNITFANHAA